MELNSQQRVALAKDNRQFGETIYTGGFAAFVQEQILDPIESGNIGIDADAGDVDALALDGGHFAQDDDTTTGLTFGYDAGRLFNGESIVSVSAGTLALSASATNYVEVSRGGVVSKNTTGFTTGSVPLYQIVTGASSITTVTNKKTLLSVLSSNTKLARVQAQIATVSATTAMWRLIAPCAGSLSLLGINVGTTITANDTDYWTFDAQYKGAAGTGTTAMLAATDANTTKATGGSGLTSNVTRSFTLHGTSANLVVVKNELIIVTATKAASAANLVTPTLTADFTFAN